MCGSFSENLMGRAGLAIAGTRETLIFVLSAVIFFLFRYGIFHPHA
jgi:hypothetical protein